MDRRATTRTGAGGLGDIMAATSRREVDGGPRTAVIGKDIVRFAIWPAFLMSASCLYLSRYFAMVSCSTVSVRRCPRRWGTSSTECLLDDGGAPDSRYFCVKDASSGAEEVFKTSFVLAHNTELADARQLASSGPAAASKCDGQVPAPVNVEVGKP